MARSLNPQVVKRLAFIRLLYQQGVFQSDDPEVDQLISLVTYDLSLGQIPDELDQIDDQSNRDSGST